MRVNIEQAIKDIEEEQRKLDEEHLILNNKMNALLKYLAELKSKKVKK